MILQIQELRVEGKKNEEIIPILVRYINTLTSSVNFALQNIGFEQIESDGGVSLEQLYATGALKGRDGEDGFSPKITVASDTDTEYRLEITTKAGSFTTPNLKGSDGAGVPAGGEAGQLLAKKSGDDYDTEWIAK